MVEVYFFCELTVIRSGRGRFFSLRFRPRPPSYTQRVTGAHPLPPLLILSSGRGNAVGALARFRRKVQKQKFARHCDFPKFTPEWKKRNSCTDRLCGRFTVFQRFFMPRIVSPRNSPNRCRGKFVPRAVPSSRRSVVPRGLQARSCRVFRTSPPVPTRVGRGSD